MKIIPILKDTAEFKAVVDDYVKLVDTLRERVEKEKMRVNSDINIFRP